MSSFFFIFLFLIPSSWGMGWNSFDYYQYYSSSSDSEADDSGANDEEDCKNEDSRPGVIAGMSLEDFLGRQIPITCKRETTGKKNYCACLDRKRKENILLVDLAKSANNKEAMKKKKEEYEEKFLSSYSQMVLESSIQRHILGETQSEKNVECSPTLMENNINEATQKHLEAQKALFEAKQKKIERKLFGCKVTDLIVETEVCKEARELKNAIDEKLKNWDKETVEVYQKVRGGDCDPESSKEMIEFLETQDQNNAEVKKHLQNLKSNKDGACGIDFDKNLKAASEFKWKVLASSDMPESCDGSLACEFTKKNQIAAKTLAANYQFDPNVQCISFAEYKTFKSLPDEKFFEELGKQKNPLDFLNPVNVPKNDVNNIQGKKLEFLRSNPMLSKALQHPGENSEKLSALLKELSTNLQGKSEPQKLKVYLDFLKNKDGLQKITSSDENKKNDLKVCADLARNYTAIKVADYLPDDGSEYNPVMDEKLKNELLACRERKKDDNKSENALLTLKIDPVFNLGDAEHKKNLDLEVKEYDQFRESNCKTLDNQTYSDYLKKNCSPSDDISVCRDKFLASSPFASINEVIDSSEIKTDLGSNGEDVMLNLFKPENQDQEFIDWFNENILSDYLKDPLAVFGMKTYAKNRANGDSLVGKTPPPLRSLKSTQKNEVAGNTSLPEAFKNSKSDGASSLNPGQVLPKFNFPASSRVDTNTASASGRRPASHGSDPVNDKPSSDYKWTSSSQEGQYAAPGINDDAKDDLEKLKKENEKLKNINTDLSKTENKSETTSASSPAKTQTSGVSGNVAAGTSGFSPVVSNIARGASSSRSAALGPSPIKKGTFNDALNSIHDKSAMNVLGGVVDPKEFKGPQQSAKDLIVDDPRKFEKLGEDPVLLEAFIKEKMKGMAVGESKIITIINSSPNRPVPHMIFRIKAKEDGSFDIQSVPSEVPVRVATLKSLIDQLPKK